MVLYSFMNKLSLILYIINLKFDSLFVALEECVQLDGHFAAQGLSNVSTRTIGVDHVAI